jgi:hypothetical protein
MPKFATQNNLQNPKSEFSFSFIVPNFKARSIQNPRSFRVGSLSKDGDQGWMNNSTFIKLLFGIWRKGEKKLLCQSFLCHRQVGARQLLAVDALTSSTTLVRVGTQ